jgi:CRP-like cAMP-binding protein
MYIVYSGGVNLYLQQKSGRRKLVTSLGIGDFFGELALVDEGPRPETAIASKNNTQLLILDKYRFTYLLRHQPDFALIVMGKLCARLRDKSRFGHPTTQSNG